MKTVAEIAKEIGVSKQAVWQKIKNQLSTDLQPFMKINGNTAYIDDNGENIIKQAFMSYKTSNNNTTTDNNKSTTTDNITSMLIDTLQKENELLREELNKANDELSKERIHSRELAERTMNLAEQMAELTRNNQVLLQQEQHKNSSTVSEILDTDTNIDKLQKKGFFSKLFS